VNLKTTDYTTIRLEQLSITTTVICQYNRYAAQDKKNRYLSNTRLIRHRQTSSSVHNFETGLMKIMVGH
jgi:hypothetical protein